MNVKLSTRFATIQTLRMTGPEPERQCRNRSGRFLCHMFALLDQKLVKICPLRESFSRDNGGGSSSRSKRQDYFGVPVRVSCAMEIGNSDRNIGCVLTIARKNTFFSHFQQKVPKWRVGGNEFELPPKIEHFARVEQQSSLVEFCWRSCRCCPRSRYGCFPLPVSSPLP